MPADWRDDQLIAILTIVSVLMLALGALWVTMFEQYFYNVLALETIAGRFIGLAAGTVLVTCILAGIVTPLFLREQRAMYRSLDGYQNLDSGVAKFIGETLFGTTTYERVRVDDLPVFLGYVGGVGLGAQMRRKQQDKIVIQREEVPCETCGTTYTEIGIDNSSKRPFVYIEKYKQWSFLIPLYTKQLETAGYCQTHTPSEYTEHLPGGEDTPPNPGHHSYQFQ